MARPPIQSNAHTPNSCPHIDDVEPEAHSVHHTGMRRFLLLLPVILILIGVVTVMMRRPTGTDTSEENPGYGLLVVLLFIGAAVAIAAFWFFQTELHVES